MVKLKQEAFKDCITKVASIAGVDEAKAFDILQQVADAGDKLNKEGKPNPFQAAAEQLAAQQQMGALQYRVRSLKDAITRSQIVREMEPFIEKGGKVTALNLMSRIRAVFDKDVTNSLNTEDKLRAIFKQIVGPMMNNIKLKGYLDAAISGKLDNEIVEQMYRNTGGENIRDDITISEPAKLIANEISKALNLTHARKNNAGAFIAAAKGFINHTTWSPERLRSGFKDVEQGFEEWLKKDSPNFHPDFVERLNNLEPKEGETQEEAVRGFLFNQYKNFLDGVHHARPDGSVLFDNEGFTPPAFKGTHNIARSESKSRVFMWKDSQAWLEHEKNFGSYNHYGSLIGSVILDTLQNDSRHIALMEDWGTNPSGNLNLILNKLRDQLHQKSPDEVQTFNSYENKLKTEFSYLTGESQMRSNATAARIYNQAAQLIASSKLGGISIPHALSAPFTVSSELAHHGVSHLDGLGATIKAGLMGRSPEEVQSRLAEVNAYANGWLYPLMQHVYKQAGGIGYIPWITQKVTQLTGIHRLLDQFQAEGVLRVHTNYFGENVGKTFEELDSLRRGMLTRYGINSGDWDLLRSADEGSVLDGQRYLTPKAASLIDRDKIETYLRDKGIIGENFTDNMVDSAIQDYRWKLADRYATYLSSSAQRATITPGIKEQAAFMGRSAPGTAEWMVRRSIAQFKMWGLAATNQIINREIALGLQNKNLAANLGWIVALATAGGAMRVAIADAIAGRPQRNFLNPVHALTAFTAGGGLGLWGEAIFGEITRSANDNLGELLGPMYKNANDLYTAYNRFRSDMVNEDPTNQGKWFDHLETEGLRFLANNIPGSNLFWLKGALDYTLFYHMYEGVSPGWWERTNRRLEREGNSTMLGYKPGAPIPYGVPYVTFGNKLLGQQ